MNEKLPSDPHRDCQEGLQLMTPDQDRTLRLNDTKENASKTALAVFVSPSQSNSLEDLSQQSILENFLEDLTVLNDCHTYVLTEERHEAWVREILPDSDNFTLSFAGPPGRDGLVEKVDRTLESLLEVGYESAMALAADTPGLGVEDVRAARERLTTGESTAVVGPAGDGGFYLLGIDSYRDGLLEDVPFFVEGTCRVLCNRLDELYSNRTNLRVLNDVDRPTDWLSVDGELQELFHWIVALVRRLLFGRKLLQAERSLDLNNRFPFLQRTLRSPPVSSSL